MNCAMARVLDIVRRATRMAGFVMFVVIGAWWAGGERVPVVSSVSFVGSPAGGATCELGETIELKVEFHRFLDYSSGLQLELTIGGQTALASHSHGHGFGGGVAGI